MENKMDTVNKRSILHYGILPQSVVCMEECSELIKEISKFIRGKGNTPHLVDEMADVYICLDMLKKMYAVDEQVLEATISAKLDRTMARIAGEKEYGKLVDYAKG